MPQAAVIAVVVAGVAISAFAAAEQGRAAKKEADFRARLAEQDAEVERQKAARELVVARQSEEDFRRDQSNLMGTRRARLGATGVEPGAGSPLLVSEDFAAEGELQALRIRAGGEVAATRLEQSALRLESEASLFRFSGRSAQRAGQLRAGSLLVSGAGQAFGAAA